MTANSIPQQRIPDGADLSDLVRAYPEHLPCAVTRP